jgi:hypothetical protein
LPQSLHNSLLCAVQHKPVDGVVCFRLSPSYESSMNLKTQFAAALVLVLLAAPAAAGQLNSQQLRALAPGSYAVSIYGLIKMTIRLQPGGSISGTTSKKKSDSGVWTVSDEKLCIRWTRWLKGKTRCTALFGDNGTYSGGGLYIRKI